MKRVYLAGPDVFFPAPREIAEHHKAFLSQLGLEGVFPLDQEIVATTPEETAQTIFEQNCRLIDSCQGVLAHMTPFRGPSTDAGTAWEIGFAFARGLPIVGYSDDLSPYRDKVFRHGYSEEGESAVDKNGHVVEHFDQSDNLMLTRSLCFLCGSFEEGARCLQDVLLRS